MNQRDVQSKTLYDLLVNEFDDIKNFHTNLLKIIEEHKD